MFVLDEAEDPSCPKCNILAKNVDIEPNNEGTIRQIKSVGRTKTKK